MQISRQKDQRGVTIFEALIILLILVLVGLSCFAIIRDIRKEQTKKDSTINQVRDKEGKVYERTQ